MRSSVLIKFVCLFACFTFISFSAVGRQLSRDNEVAPSNEMNRVPGDRDQLTERRINIKRIRHEIRVSSDSDDSSDSGPMVFHNYAKRRRNSETEDENYTR